jgi:hypothetical protein
LGAPDSAREYAEDAVTSFSRGISMAPATERAALEAGVNAALSMGPMPTPSLGMMRAGAKAMGRGLRSLGLEGTAPDEAPPSMAPSHDRGRNLVRVAEHGERPAGDVQQEADMGSRYGSRRVRARGGYNNTTTPGYGGGPGGYNGLAGPAGRGLMPSRNPGTGAQEFASPDPMKGAGSIPEAGSGMDMGGDGAGQFKTTGAQTGEGMQGPAPASGDDKNVSANLDRLLESNSTYMKRARSQGRQAANRRGLLNSSMAAGAAQASAIDAALPIASQQADIAAQSDLLDREMDARMRLQKAQDAAAKQRLGMQLTSEEERLAQELGSRADLLDTEFGYRQEMAEDEIASREDIAAADRAAREDIAEMREVAAIRRANTQSRMDNYRQRLANQSRERIATMEVKSSNRREAADAATQFESIYQNAFNNLQANQAVPADVRGRYLEQLGRQRDSNMRVIEQIYNTDLDWTPVRRP